VAPSYVAHTRYQVLARRGLPTWTVSMPPRPLPIRAPTPRLSTKSANPLPALGSRRATMPWRPCSGVVGQIVATTVKLSS
jgi:hypothetical protein